MGGSTRAARRRRHRKALISSTLRKLFTASAITTVVRAVVGQGQSMGDNLTDRLAERAKRGIEIQVRRVVVWLIAGLLFAVAGGFLVAAGFMGLMLVVSPPIAAVIVAAALALVGGLTLVFGRNGAEQEATTDSEAAAEQPAAEQDTPGEEAGTAPGPDQAALLAPLMAILDGALKYAGRNLGLIAAVLFLVALWFGLAGDDEDDERREEDDDLERAERPPPPDEDPYRERAAAGI